MFTFALSPWIVITRLVPSDFTEIKYRPGLKFRPLHFTLYGSKNLPAKSAFVSFALGAEVISVWENSYWSGATSACACTVAGSRHANPRAAAKIEALVTVVFFISISLESLNPNDSSRSSGRAQFHSKAPMVQCNAPPLLIKSRSIRISLIMPLLLPIILRWLEFHSGAQ